MGPTRSFFLKSSKTISKWPTPSAPHYDVLVWIFSSTLYLTFYFVTTADTTAEFSQPRLLYCIGQIPGTRKTSNTETNDFTQEAISEEIPDQFFSPWKASSIQKLQLMEEQWDQLEAQGRKGWRGKQFKGNFLMRTDLL